MKLIAELEVNETSTWPNGSKTLLADLNEYKQKNQMEMFASAVWQAVAAGHCVKVLEVKEAIKLGK